MQAHVVAAWAMTWHDMAMRRRKAMACHAMALRHGLGMHAPSHTLSIDQNLAHNPRTPLPAGPSGSCVREICRTTGADIKSWTADPDEQCTRSCRVFRWACRVGWQGAGEGAWHAGGGIMHGHEVQCGAGGQLHGIMPCMHCLCAHARHLDPHAAPCLAAGSRGPARAWRPRWASCVMPWLATRSCVRAPTQVGQGLSGIWP